MITRVGELDTIAAAGDEQAPGERPSLVSDAWERFLLERARESGCRPLRRWRDEEGL
jgi:hypothetical protein